MDNGGPNTSPEGAAIGAAVGAIAVYFTEILAKIDVPPAIEGAILVVVTYLLARLIPPR